jgi:hypothetical protein
MTDSPHPVKRKAIRHPKDYKVSEKEQRRNEKVIQSMIDDGTYKIERNGIVLAPPVKSP